MFSGFPAVWENSHKCLTGWHDVVMTFHIHMGKGQKKNTSLAIIQPMSQDRISQFSGQEPDDADGGCPAWICTVWRPYSKSCSSRNNFWSPAIQLKLTNLQLLPKLSIRGTCPLYCHRLSVHLLPKYWLQIGSYLRQFKRLPLNLRYLERASFRVEPLLLFNITRSTMQP